MKLIEKLVWVFAALTVAVLVLVMIYWKPSHIPTDALVFKEKTVAPTVSKKSGPDFSSPGSSSGKGTGSTSTRSTGSSRNSGTGQPKEKLKYPVKARNPKVKSYTGPREFREKYGNNYREVWEAMQKAEAQLIEKPDGSKVVKIISIEKGSVIDKLQFMEGDEIFSVNGRDFSEFEGSAGELYQLGKEWHSQLRDETDFQIEIVRGGSPVILHYNIPK